MESGKPKPSQKDLQRSFLTPEGEIDPVVEREVKTSDATARILEQVKRLAPAGTEEEDPIEERRKERWEQHSP